MKKLQSLLTRPRATSWLLGGDKQFNLSLHQTQLSPSIKEERGPELEIKDLYYSVGETLYPGPQALMEQVSYQSHQLGLVLL